MTELEVIRRSSAPVTTKDTAIALANLGVREGDVLVVHASLSELGWVAGGPQAVLDGLFTAVGETGTITMPAHSGGLSEPSNWQNPPVPESWWETIREEMSPFDVNLTPLREM
ncbi:MAG: SPBc2 prophage-derived aminoglycoside N(3)-acetyltransferase-like protein yokD, partial [Actinomycetota bacterium]